MAIRAGRCASTYKCKHDKKVSNGKRFASYYRQLSTDCKMKNYNIKTSFVSPEGLKEQSNKTVFCFIFIIVEIYLKYDAIHDYSVWL